MSATLPPELERLARIALAAGAVVMRHYEAGAAARLLPRVADVVVWNCPWVSPQPPPVRGSEIEGVVADLAARRFDEAVVLTSLAAVEAPSAAAAAPRTVRRAHTAGRPA